jgi:hypothetical protein
MIHLIFDKAEKVAAALGAGGVAFSIYTAAGLPIPATIAQVDKRIEIVNDAISGVRLENLEGRRSIIQLTRVSLRNEKGAIERSMESLDSPARVTMNRRVGEIGDQLKELDDQDAEVRAKMNSLKPK